MDDTRRAERLTLLLDTLAGRGESYHRLYGPTTAWACGRIVAITPEGDFRWDTGTHAGDDPAGAAARITVRGWPENDAGELQPADACATARGCVTPPHKRRSPMDQATSPPDQGCDQETRISTHGRL
jgi:hypothetical protein